MASHPDRCRVFHDLHASGCFVIPNPWDVGAARALVSLGFKALATTSSGFAWSIGRPDHGVALDEMLAHCRNMAAAVDVPVSADLEASYGDAGETVRRAIGVGVVGANLEDQMRPLPEAAAAVRAAVTAGDGEGVSFVVNARTDAFLTAADRDPKDVLLDAVERGRAFLDEGAACVFVPGQLDEPTVAALVDGIGERRVSVIAAPGSLSTARLAELGVARVSFGPFTQWSTLAHLADLAADVYAGAPLPPGLRPPT